MSEKKSKLAVITYSGDFGRVHYALSMAAAAAAIGRPVTLFFTMGALHALSKDGSLPGADRDQCFAQENVATFDELLAAVAELDIRIIACEMGLRAEKIKADDLRRDIEIEIAGLVTLFNDAGPDGQIVFL